MSGSRRRALSGGFVRLGTRSTRVAAIQDGRLTLTRPPSDAFRPCCLGPSMIAKLDLCWWQFGHSSCCQSYVRL
jgi:hypothetical protein